MTPAFAVLAHDPEFVESLPPLERAVLAYLSEFWLRQDQKIPRDGWRSYTYIGGRGLGKTHAVASYITDAVTSGDIPAQGERASIGLMAPTEDRAEEVQIRTLIDLAPPHWRPERYRGGLVWPNGVVAATFTPLAPGGPRSDNLALSWLTEIVAWNPSSRREAFNNITTATRIRRAQYVCDTTSKGQNDVIEYLLAQHERDPQRNRLVRGTLLDNPLLSEDYIADECAKYVGQEFGEEVLGRTYREAAGAQFKAAWLENNRVTESPRGLTVGVIDPAQSTHDGSDETGLGRLTESGGHIYFRDDESGRHAPEVWGDIAVRWCKEDASGLVIERNKTGDLGIAVIRARAKEAGMTVRELTERDRTFPQRTRGVIYVREVWAASSKATRAGGPAALTQQGRVHLVGVHEKLENQLKTFVPGSGPSPNRLDVFVYGVLELAGLLRDGVMPVRVGEARELTKIVDALTRGRAGADVSTLATLMRGGAGRRID